MCGKHLVEEVLDHHAAGLDHVLDHLRVVVGGVGQPLEGEHVADLADHRAAVDAERVVAACRVTALERLDVDLARRVVAAEALLLDLVPILGRDDGGLDVVGDGVVTVLGHLGQQPVGVHQDGGGFPLLDDLIARRPAAARPCRRSVDAVEVEEDVGLGVVGDAVLAEDRPDAEVLVPVAELHIEAAVDRLVVHLAHEAFAVGHRSGPFGPAGCDGHVSLPPPDGYPSIPLGRWPADFARLSIAPRSGNVVLETVPVYHMNSIRLKAGASRTMPSSLPICRACQQFSARAGHE